MNKWLNIKVSRCLLVISEQELNGLLAKDPELWKTALKRGKAFSRAAQTRERVSRKVEAEAYHDMRNDIVMNQNGDAERGPP